MTDRQKEARVILSDLIADGEFPRTATREEKATYLKKIEKWLEDRDDARKKRFLTLLTFAPGGGIIVA